MIGAPDHRRRRRGPGEGSARSGAPERRVVPFDYAFRFSLSGSPGAAAQQSVEVSVEGEFTAVSIGYGVVPEVHPVTFGIAPSALLRQLDRLDRAGDRGTSLAFDTVPLRFLIAALAEQLDETPPSKIGAAKIRETGTDDFEFGGSEFASTSPVASPETALARALADNVSQNSARPAGPRTAAALRNGFRLNPEFAELLLQAERRSLPLAALARCFQAVTPPPADVQFKYALFDDGSGREFQSEPILNTAGLGAADGARPFRYFARPIVFSPRARIRMQIIEVGDFRGELHVSLQGYKRLGEAGTPTGRTSR
jgi:hypothetical protein